nr:MAG TPA: hypothetical protein [Caudoviricetes sp.]
MPALVNTIYGVYFLDILIFCGYTYCTAKRKGVNVYEQSLRRALRSHRYHQRYGAAVCKLAGILHQEPGIHLCCFP